MDVKVHLAGYKHSYEKFTDYTEGGRTTTHTVEKKRERYVTIHDVASFAINGSGALFLWGHDNSVMGAYAAGQFIGARRVE
jgi:hypothetical protein